MTYHGMQMLRRSGGPGSTIHRARLRVTNSIIIDPATDGGARAEVSIKGFSGGTFMMTSVRSGRRHLCEIEIRYSWVRGTAAFMFTRFSAIRVISGGGCRRGGPLHQTAEPGLRLDHGGQGPQHAGGRADGLGSRAWWSTPKSSAL